MLNAYKELISLTFYQKSYHGLDTVATVSTVFRFLPSNLP